MTEPVPIAIIDDDKEMLRLLSRFLQRNDCTVDTYPDPRLAITAFSRQQYGVVISDVQMPGMSGLEVLRHIQVSMPGTIVIMITGFGSVSSAVEAMKEGAFDYISKPFDLDELLVVVQKAQRQYKLEKELVDLRNIVRSRFGYRNMIGKCQAMRDVFQIIERVAPTRAPVLIEGGSGTGKELIARAIHMASPRVNAPFVAINCGALPESLLESELFGHERGAYTGAIARSDGLFVSADKGTLFLDEIIDMPLSMQAKLLRVLEDWEVRPVGGSVPRKIDVRVLSASKVDLASAAAEGRFREDLLYRLNVVTIHLPSLRERTEDIPLLIDHFLRNLPHADEKASLTVDREAIEVLLRYPWPGNIRELEHVIERASILAQNNLLTVDDLPRTLVEHAQEAARNGLADFQPSTLEDMEREYILRILKHSQWKRSVAAEILGINRRTLYRKMQEYGWEDNEEIE